MSQNLFQDKLLGPLVAFLTVDDSQFVSSKYLSDSVSREVKLSSAHHGGEPY